MAFLGAAGSGAIILGQLITVVGRPGIGLRTGQDLGDALRLGRWRGVEVNRPTPITPEEGGVRHPFVRPAHNDGGQARTDSPKTRNAPGRGHEGGILASTSTCAEDSTARI